MQTTRHICLRPMGLAIVALGALSLTQCLSDEPEGIAPAIPAATTVKMDFLHRPLPEIPLPNDIATRYDETSATKRRLNASMIAPTGFERRMRELLDEQDGWGTYQPITIPFTGPLDPMSIVEGHRDKNYDPSNDVIYLIDIDRGSPDFGKLQPLDLGEGNYPVVLEKIDNYWRNDPRGWTLSLLFEEENEDANNNGVLDPGEDTDADGVLDTPNYLPGHDPARDDLGARSDALMTFYESETQTVIAKPLVPLRERTTYAVVVTRRLKDAQGDPVGSPYPFINHNGQTEALRPLPEVLPEGLALGDVAFAFTFTTQTLASAWEAVRDGLYGHGVQSHIAEEAPAEVGGILPLRDEDAFPSMSNPHIMYSENWLSAYRVIAENFLGADEGTVTFTQLLEHNQYVDYHVIGYYDSPQLFEREDEDGKWLPFNDQSWPADLDRVPAPVRNERVYFHLTVPRKEVSARGEGKPAPVVILGHGYGGNRFDIVTFGGYFAKHGLATLAIDNVSHGISIDPETRDLAKDILGGFGLGGFAEAVFLDRAHDQNGDGTIDSGADFWSAYLFHTRDVVRQTALDYSQLIRVLRTFDGERRWGMDVDSDGTEELAGDFDADGVVDIGGEGMITMLGGSLGGMMTVVMGSLEPELEAIAPVIPGGGLSDIGIRSKQSGVPEAFILRSMSPIYIGTRDADSGTLTLETIVPDLNDVAEIVLTTVEGIDPFDTMVVENLVTGERGCGYVNAEGLVRTSVASDKGDETRVLFFEGEALVLGDTDCTIKAGAEPKAIVDSFEQEIVFQTEVFEQGSPLEALAEGLGLRRANPEFRRLQGIGQVVLDPADPAVYARHMLQEPLTYKGTGQTTGAHMLLIPSIGDMSVPVNTGISIGRAAGLVEYLEDNPAHGKPDNQIYIDTFTSESVNTMMRYASPDGVGIHMDVDNYSEGDDLWPYVPRLDPPVRASFDKTDPLGGRSTMALVYGDPTGRHGFASPGEMIDDVRAQCEADCEDASCECDEARVFDVGNFFLNFAGNYLASGGMELRTDRCFADDDCDDKPALPDLRPNPDDPDAEPMDMPDDCTFPAPVVGGEAALDAIADDPARCGAPGYAWIKAETLGDVTGYGEPSTFPATLLQTLASSNNIPLPREAKHDTAIQQFSYMTQARGEEVEGTALVAFPTNREDKTPMEMLLFLNDAEGVHSDCSNANALEQRALMALLASFGHVVVAPDPLGLRGFGEGDGELLPYLIGEAAALPALDAIRAVGKLPGERRSVCVSPEVVVVGGGMGGHNALFVDLFAPYYAPELDILGGVSLAAPTDLGAHLERGLDGEVSAISNDVAVFLRLAARWYGQEEMLDEAFAPEVAGDLMTSLEGECDLSVLEPYATLEEAFDADFLQKIRDGELADTAPWACFAAENSPSTTTIPWRETGSESHGFLFILGADDDRIASDIERESFAALCGARPVSFLECAGADHGDVTLFALPEILDFLDARLAGEPFSTASGCEPAAPIECEGSP